jgi:hypothetical protein
MNEGDDGDDDGEDDAENDVIVIVVDEDSENWPKAAAWSNAAAALTALSADDRSLSVSLLLPLLLPPKGDVAPSVFSISGWSPPAEEEDEAVSGLTSDGAELESRLSSKRVCFEKCFGCFFSAWSPCAAQNAWNVRVSQCP